MERILQSLKFPEGRLSYSTLTGWQFQFWGAVLLGASLIRQRETQRQKREGTKNHESLEKSPQVNKRNVHL
jgi:hypothetical protein